MVAVYAELHVPGFEPVKEFYGAFGFVVEREDSGDGGDAYLVMSLNHSVLCFWPGNDSVWNQSYFKKFPRDTPRGFGVEIAIAVDDLEVAFNEAVRRECVVEPVKAKPWGVKDFRMVDPFGFYLRVSEHHDVITGTE